MEPDGLIFDPDTVTGERIAEDADYAGVRVRLLGMLGNARINIQVDVGFGDVVHPAPRVTAYPTILDLPAPRLRAYSRETSVAEKFEAMVKLGLLNSRMKDFFDIWLLCQQYEFDGKTLATAIARTFAHRETMISRQPRCIYPRLFQSASEAGSVARFYSKNPPSASASRLRGSRSNNQRLPSAFGQGSRGG